MSDQALIVLDGWKPPRMAEAAIEERSELLAALNMLAKVEIKTPQAAANAAEVIGQARRWETDIEEHSKSMRDPFFQHSKKIKACSDEFMLPVLQDRMKVERQLAEWEAEQIRIKQNLERQAKAEADRKRREEEQLIREAEAKRQAEERAEAARLEAIEADKRAAKNAAEKERLARLAEEERQRQIEAQAKRDAEYQSEQRRLVAITPAPVAFEPAKTEGVNSAVAIEFDVTDQQQFAEWCWNTGHADWVREIAFEKRLVKTFLDKLPADKPLPQIPGLDLRRVVAVNVKKATKQRIRDVATTRVALEDAPAQQEEPVLSQWIDTPHSSQILRVGYDPERLILQIVFKNGGSIYDYYQVPAAVFEGFRTADSVGVYFGKTVKGVFAYQKRL